MNRRWITSVIISVILAATASAGWGDPTWGWREIRNGNIAAGVTVTSNSVTITPDCNLQTWLDYIEMMQEWDANNWGTLILMPGIYNVDTIVQDVNYIKVAGAGRVKVKSSVANGEVWRQDANVIRLEGFGIDADGIASSGLRIACANNWPSSYDNMDFNSVYYDDGGAECAPVWGDTFIGGYWSHCNGNTGSWNAGPGGIIDGIYNDSYVWADIDDHSQGYGDYGWGQDRAAKVAVKLFNCAGRNFCVGGCNTQGIEVTSDARIIECDFNDYCVAMGNPCAAIIKRSTFNNKCCGGYLGSGTAYGTFGGRIEDSRFTAPAATNSSLGMGHASCVQSGTILNTHIGTDAELKAGTRPALPSTDTSVVIRDCQPFAPTPFTASITIYPFDDGQTFIRTGGTGTLTVTLPAAKVGRRVTIIDVDNDSGEDVGLIRSGTDTFTMTDGSVINSNIACSTDVYSLIELQCFIDGKWSVIIAIGTWIELI